MLNLQAWRFDAAAGLQRRARIQAGIKGPDLERQLKQHGLTLRHYPQSFPFVSLGGPAPCFTFYCVADTTGDLGKALEKWKQLKRISMEVLAEQGATVTHHHAVGRDHRFGYEQQTSPLFRQTLAAGKQFLDPHGILNPGALIDPQDKTIGITGVSSL